MAEEFGDKTETATPRRREEAREEGHVARSADLTAAVLLLGFLIMLKNFGPPLVTAMRSVLEKMLSAESFAELGREHLAPTILSAVGTVAAALAPLMVGAVIIAIMVNLVQVGFQFNFARLAINFGALNPLRGAGKLFRGPGMMQLLMNLLKIGLAGIVAYSAVADRIGEIVSAQQLSYMQVFGLGTQIMYAIALRVGILLLVLALLDWGYQKYRFEQELKMTKQEVKEELRRMEGDPKIKQRRRQIAQQMAQQRLKKEVPTADVVVTNPTEFAIALKYDSTTMHAPRVVAKGQGHMAARIRQIAIAAGVPIIERKPLARALYKLVEAGQEIPEQFYSAVAEILAYVYELTGKLRRQSA